MDTDSQQIEEQDSPLSDLQSLEEVQQTRARLFPSIESLRWYLRRHRKGLEDCGALIYVNGRLWARPRQFDKYVVRDGQQAVRRTTAAA